MTRTQALRMAKANKARKERVADDRAYQAWRKTTMGQIYEQFQAGRPLRINFPKNWR